jgi:hypothetical protein
MKAELLHVVTVVTNPRRFNSRYKLYREFAKRVTDAGCPLYTVECALGERPHVLTEPNNPRHVQLRSRHELWHKENMINIGIQRLPHDWKYVAWLDSDILFTVPNWAEEIVHQLQHYDFVQVFSEAIDLGPNYEVVQKHHGYVYSWRQNRVYTSAYSNWHSGYGWAARREAVDAIGGLIEIGILGAADRHMAAALVGKMDESLPPDAPTKYREEIELWQARALAHVNYNVGYLPGTILHYWHGKKADRGYKSRWQILIEEDFDPRVDLKKDAQGLWQLTPRNPKLRDKIRAYFQSRNEDSVDVD